MLPLLAGRKDEVPRGLEDPGRLSILELPGLVELLIGLDDGAGCAEAAVEEEATWGGISNGTLSP